MALILVASASVTSCEILGIGPGADLRIAISPRDMTIAVGDTAMVTYNFFGSEGGSVYTRLESISPAIASVVVPDRVVGRDIGSTFLVLAAWSDGRGSARDSILVTVQ